MPEYISRFLEKGIRLLLQNNGQEFLNEYYKYIYKIYNYQIPLKQIASKGKVKKSLDDYVADCNTITKAGTKKSRQAWMELALKEKMKVDLGETLYYINIGIKKSDSDVKRVTKYYEYDSSGNMKTDMTKVIEKEFKALPNRKSNKNPDGIPISEWVKKAYPNVVVEDEVTLNCMLVPRHIVESENDYFCEDGQEYNVVKYIEQFNNRITPLLVCFSKEIRGRILVSNPKDRPYFTEEESRLCSGQPNKIGDQDTYDQLMTMEDKEIKFWLNHPEWDVPFLDECGMKWDDIVKEYQDRKEKEKMLGIDKTRELVDEIFRKMSLDEYDAFIDDGEMPAKLSLIVEIDPEKGVFVDKNYKDMVIFTPSDVIDAKEYRMSMMEEEYEAQEYLFN